MPIKEMVEKKNALHERAQALLNAAKEGKRELTDAEMAELAEIRDNVRKIIEFMQLDDDFRELEKQNVGGGEPSGGASGGGEKSAEVRAFEDFVRGVINERANLDVTAGNALIPTEILDQIIAKVYEICPILDKASKYNVKGKLDIPYYGEDSTHLVDVDYREEFVELTSNVGTFSTIELGGFLAGALTLISRSLINSQNFNLTDFIVERMAYSIKRWIEKELLNGTTNKIEGLSGVTQQVETAASNAITADELIRLHDTVLDEYQGNAVWIMSRQTRTAVRTLKDSMERYLLQDDISLPFGSSILGKPVLISDNMPEIGAGNTAIYYGDLSGLAVKWVEEMAVEVLREKYATQHAIGVVGWLELDSKVQDQQKLAKLVCKGTS